MRCCCKNEVGLLLVPSTRVSTPHLTLISTLVGYESSRAQDLSRQGDWTLCPGLRSRQVDEQASPTSASAIAAFYFLGLAAWHLLQTPCFHKKYSTLVWLHNICIFSLFKRSVRANRPLVWVGIAGLWPLWDLCPRFQPWQVEHSVTSWHLVVSLWVKYLVLFFPFWFGWVCMGF